jgi:hypothetical protein
MSYNIQRISKTITVLNAGTTASATNVPLNGLLRGIQATHPTSTVRTPTP